MEAVVTIKATVSELDTIRAALALTIATKHGQSFERSLDPAVRREAAAVEAQAASLLEKLGGAA